MFNIIIGSLMIIIGYKRMSGAQIFAEAEEKRFSESPLTRFFMRLGVTHSEADQKKSMIINVWINRILGPACIGLGIFIIVQSVRGM